MTLFSALREACARPIHEVDDLGIHVAATGNAYTFAKNIVTLLDEAEARISALAENYDTEGVSFNTSVAAALHRLLRPTA